MNAAPTTTPAFLTLRLNRDLLDWYANKAAANGTTRSDEIRAALTTYVALDDDGSPSSHPPGIEPSSSSAPTNAEGSTPNGAASRRARSIRAGTTGTSTAQTDASQGSLREAQDPTCRSHVDLRPALTTANNEAPAAHLGRVERGRGGGE